MKTIPEIPYVAGFIRLCDIGDRNGFHEANGGNTSYHLTADDVRLSKSFLKGHRPGPWTDVDPKGDVAVPGLGGEWFLVTGSGKFMRNVAYDPEDSIALCELDKSGAHYRVWWGLCHGGRPTSEFASHLMMHEVKFRVSDGRTRVLYHAHPPCLIAATYVLPVSDKAITRALWNTMTETSVVFPKGFGAVKWMVPGGRDVAVATAKLMDRFDDAIWYYHGALCTAETFDSAMGRMEVIEKSAKIFLAVAQSGLKRRGSIDSDGYRAIAKMYKLDLAERFL